MARVCDCQFRPSSLSSWRSLVVVVGFNRCDLASLIVAVVATTFYILWLCVSACWTELCPVDRSVIELWSFAVSTVRYCVALVLVFICRMLNGSATSALQMTFNLLLLVWLIYCDVSRELEACWPRTLNPTMPYHTIVGCAAQWYWTGRTSVSDRRTFPSCARPAADGWPLVVKQLYVSQPG